MCVIFDVKYIYEMCKERCNGDFLIFIEKVFINVIVVDFFF